MNTQVMSNNNLAQPVSNDVVEEILIPAERTGILIGTSGKNINHLMSKFRVVMRLVQFDNKDRTADKFLMIQGKPDEVEAALTHVRKNYVERELSHSKDNNGNDQIYRKVKIARERVGVVIGAGGRTIRDIETKSGVLKISVYDAEPSSMSEPYAIVRGNASQVEHAVRLINDRANPPIRHQISTFINVPKEIATHFMDPNAPYLDQIRNHLRVNIRLHSVDVATQMHTFEIHGLQSQVNHAKHLFFQHQNELMSTKMSSYPPNMGFPIMMPAPPVNYPMNHVVMHPSFSYSTPDIAGTVVSGPPNATYQSNGDTSNLAYNQCVQFQPPSFQPPIYDASTQGTLVLGSYVPHQFQLANGLMYPYATQVPSIPMLHGNNPLQSSSNHAYVNQPLANSQQSWAAYYAQPNPPQHTAVVNQTVVEVPSAEECREAQQQSVAMRPTSDASGCQPMYTATQQQTFYTAIPPITQGPQ